MTSSYLQSFPLSKSPSQVRVSHRISDVKTDNLSYEEIIKNVGFSMSLARPGGLEPPAHSLEGCCSIQLS